ncbi:MAG TPA: beta-L-arabinofuranosidase domain-containing protein [Kofleriaceae bacterium]|nr:beta-L-arabinofuranosidase domain-containing protein [Kofleriaceae bacterium]
MTRRRIALVAVWTLPSVVFVALTAVVYRAYRIAPPDRLGDAERTAAMLPLRAALDDGDPPPCTLRRAGGEVAATVWLDGRALVQVDADAPELGAAIDQLALALRARMRPRALDPATRTRARIQLDILGGRAPLGGGEPVFAALAVPGIADMLPVNPGVEGVGATALGKTVYLLPYELVELKLVAAKRPSEAMPDFAVGLDLPRLTTILGTRAGRQGVIAPSSLFRFRSDAFVERAADQRPGAPLPLVRGLPPAPPVTARTLRDAALAGGHYLVDHLAPSGRYIYEHDVTTGTQTDPARGGAYSMPRHAGTTYFLAQLYRITREPWLREPIERAIAHLVDLVAAGHCGGTLPDGTAYDCVLDRGETTAQLGSTALAVVALAEYQRATGDPRYLPLAQKLVAFILFMQRADGSFRHVFDPRTKQPDDKAQQLYYSGESALALARMYEITGDPRYAAAAERALDWLVDWYDFFLGGFFYGEEHWTCIAAEAIWPAVKSEKYREFCDGYATFSRGEQPQPGDDPDLDDLAGAYNVTPFVMPYNTPSGSRTEAMISTYQLELDHGAPDPRVRAQIRLALQYLLGQQLRPDSDFAAIGDVDGGIPASAIERTIRIDYVQHVCSAMIRASQWIDDPPGGPASM